MQTQQQPPMRRYSLLAFLVVTTIITIAAWSGISTVPFHPDESTYLFMAADFQQFLHQPAAMTWQPQQSGSSMQRYRAIDAPLIRYLTGFGLWLGGKSPLPTDWDWGKTWQQNQQAGALPDPQTLLTGRFASAALLPLSMILLFFTGRRLGSDLTAWVAALLLASNALVLLLNRRVVAEGLVIFTTTWTMYSLATATRHAWRTAMPAALAFCAKHTLAAVAPVALLSVLWQPSIALPKRLQQAGLFIALYLGVVIALNPFLWAHPLEALQYSVIARQELTQNQVADRPEQALHTPAQRLIGMVGALYLTPPILAEVGNYRSDTHTTDEAYLSKPYHQLLRSLPGGGILLVITIFGSMVAMMQVVRPMPSSRITPNRGTANRRMLCLLLLAAALQGTALLVFVPLPFQRYYLPLVPYACLFAANGLSQILVPLVTVIRNAKYQ